MNKTNYYGITCECMFHRYHFVHICDGCNKIISHSQGDFDDHKKHLNCYDNIPSDLYEHGDTVQTLTEKFNSTL